MRRHTASPSPAISRQPPRRFRKISRSVSSRISEPSKGSRKKNKNVKTSLKKSKHFRKSVCGNRPKKSIENPNKMVPGRCLGHPLWLPGASRAPVQAGFQTQPKINEEMEGFWDAPGTSWEAPGDPEGTKNRPQIVFFLKKCIPNVNLLWIVERNAIFRAFCAICHRFFMKNDTRAWTPNRSLILKCSILLRAKRGENFEILRFRYLGLGT